MFRKGCFSSSNYHTFCTESFIQFRTVIFEEFANNIDLLLHNLILIVTRHMIGYIFRLFCIVYVAYVIIRLTLNNEKSVYDVIKNRGTEWIVNSLIV